MAGVAMDVCLGVPKETTKVGRKLECQEQCIDHIPYYLSGLSRALFFPTTFLEIAAYTWQRGVNRIKSFICRRACLVFVIIGCHCFQPHLVPVILVELTFKHIRHYGKFIQTLWQ